MIESESVPRVVSASRSVPLAKMGLGIAALALVIVLGRWAGGYIPVFKEWVEGLGLLGPLVFIVGYALAVVAFVPASLLTLASGAIFGLAAGTVYVFAAASLGSCLAFLVSRYVARQAVERKVASNRSFAAIDRAIGEQGRKIVFLLRLSPVFPFNLLNYALGLTKVRFGDYAIASLGMLPGTLLYVYSGRVGGELAAAAGGAEIAQGHGQTALLVVGLMATVIVTTLVTRIARKALAEATGKES